MASNRGDYMPIRRRPVSQTSGIPQVRISSLQGDSTVRLDGSSQNDSTTQIDDSSQIDEISQTDEVPQTHSLPQVNSSQRLAADARDSPSKVYATTLVRKTSSPTTGQDRTLRAFKPNRQRFQLWRKTNRPSEARGRRSRPSKPVKERFRVWGAWSWELFAMSCAVLFLVAIYVLLRKYNSKTLPKWKASITVNTVAALFSTFLRACIVFVLAGVISQAKWLWISGQKTRPLQDLQYIDSGSRGILGSIKLIWKLTLRNPLVALTALGTIISLGIVPFTQQAIKTVSCPQVVNAIGAQMSYARIVPQQLIYVSRVGVYLSNQDNRNLLTGLYAAMNLVRTQETQLAPICATGNCTFEGDDPAIAGVHDIQDGVGTYSTVGFCRRCIDTSPLARPYFANTTGTMAIASNEIQSYQLPNGLATRSTMVFNVTSEYSLDWAASQASAEFMRLARWATVNVSYIGLTTDSCGANKTSQCPANVTRNLWLDGPTIKAPTFMRPLAVSCTLYPCARRFAAPNITISKLKETFLDDSPMLPDNVANHDFGIGPNSIAWANFEMTNFYWFKSPCRVNGTVYTWQNMSAAPNTKKIAVLGGIDGTSATFDNVTAPQLCTYSVSARWLAIHAQILQSSGFYNDKFFDGSCALGSYGRPVSCDNDGSKSWVSTLFADGTGTFETGDQFFENFTLAMTNLWRTQYGATVVKQIPRTNSSSGQPVLDDYGKPLIDDTRVMEYTQGKVWTTTICTTVRWPWLIYPLVLVIATMLVFCWTVFQTWRKRHEFPVWKDSMLPAIFHRDQLVDVDELRSGETGYTSNADDRRNGLDAGTASLLETSEMAQIAAGINIRLRKSRPFVFQGMAADGEEMQSMSHHPTQPSRTAGNNDDNDDDDDGDDGDEVASS